MTQLQDHLSQNPNDTMTQEWKLGLRARPRRQGFRSGVIVSPLFLLTYFYDTVTQVLGKAPTHAHAYAHTRPQGDTLTTMCLSCHRVTGSRP